MKKGILIVFITLFGISANAQDETKVRTKEVGLTFYDLNGFGVTYRIGNQNALWRFNSTFANGGQNFFGDNETSSISFGASAGREWRKSLADKLEFRYGFDIQYSYRYSIDEVKRNGFEYDNTSRSDNGGVNLVLGLNYQLSNSIFIGAELLPFVRYTYNDNEGYTVNQDQFGNLYAEKIESSNYAHSFGIQNNSALLSVVYRF